MRRLGIITGLLVEAKCVTKAVAIATRKPAGNVVHRRSPPEPPLLCAVAGDAARAYAEARAMADQGVCGLVSLGVAGGLDPRLKPGDILIANAVVDESGASSPTNAVWREAMLATLDATHSGAIFGVDHALYSVGEKQAAYARLGAVAVDMESHGVARAARETGLPFLIVRTIADTAATALPDAVRHAIGPNGERLALPVMAGLLRRPGELSAVLRLARESGAAIRALDRTAPGLLATLPPEVDKPGLGSTESG